MPAALKTFVNLKSNTMKNLFPISIEIDMSVYCYEEHSPQYLIQLTGAKIRVLYEITK